MERGFVEYENMRLLLSDAPLPAGLPVRKNWHYLDLNQLRIANCRGCFPPGSHQEAISISRIIAADTATTVP